jgi:hypothetical protein
VIRLFRFCAIARDKKMPSLARGHFSDLPDIPDNLEVGKRDQQLGRRIVYVEQGFPGLDS